MPRRLHRRFPTAEQLVYDNDNFFVIGFGRTLRASDAIFSLAAQRSGLSLCFLQHGAGLPDPAGLLRGSGEVVRNVGLASAAALDRPKISALVDAAVARATVPTDACEEVTTSTGPARCRELRAGRSRPG